MRTGLGLEDLRRARPCALLRRSGGKLPNRGRGKQRVHRRRPQVGTALREAEARRHNNQGDRQASLHGAEAAGSRDILRGRRDAQGGDREAEEGAS